MRRNPGLDTALKGRGFLAGFVSAILMVAWPGPSLAADEVASAESIRAVQVEILLDVLACVESNNNPLAVGDQGRALGTYQIHQAYWEEGTRWLGVNWPFREAFDPDKARCVVRAYLLHHGCGMTLLDMARIHNGGPTGPQRRSTLPYARRVDRLLVPRLRDSELGQSPGCLPASVSGEGSRATIAGSQTPDRARPQVISNKV
jgi:hypothetical protein